MACQMYGTVRLAKSNGEIRCIVVIGYVDIIIWELFGTLFIHLDVGGATGTCIVPITIHGHQRVYASANGNHYQPWLAPLLGD